MTRLIVFTSAFAIAAGAALAGDSVLYLNSKPSKSGSIITYSCDDCPELKPDFIAPNVHGVEVQEHEHEGGKKIVQHDNMMGGSAVRIVRSGNTQDNYAGQTVTRVPGGTVVTSGAPVVETVEPGQTPVVADSNVTVSGGSDMNVEEVTEDGVDDGSQTSSVESVNMNAAQHDNAGPGEPEEKQPHNDGPEIIDLRD